MLSLMSYEHVRMSVSSIIHLVLVRFAQFRGINSVSEFITTARGGSAHQPCGAQCTWEVKPLLAIVAKGLAIDPGMGPTSTVRLPRPPLPSLAYISVPSSPQQQSILCPAFSSFKWWAHPAGGAFHNASKIITSLPMRWAPFATITFSGEFSACSVDELLDRSPPWSSKGPAWRFVVVP